MGSWIQLRGAGTPGHAGRVHGVSDAPRCGRDRMGAPGAAGHDVPMADDRPLTPARRSDDRMSADARPGLTQEEFDALATELQQLQSTYEDELAGRLRDARAYGSPGDNEDVLAVHEEVSINAERIARLKELLRSAPIVDRDFDGGVSLGCTVRVADDAGRIAEYVLIGRRSAASARHEVSSGSPVGRALLGGRPGQVVHVQLPDGGDRPLRILDVTPGSIGAHMAAVPEGDAEPA
jgi:transcription elongation factor GreA